MNRIEIIYALAQYAHPSWYHKILNWPTIYLEMLLYWYKENSSDIIQKKLESLSLEDLINLNEIEDELEQRDIKSRLDSCYYLIYTK